MGIQIEEDKLTNQSPIHHINETTNQVTNQLQFLKSDKRHGTHKDPYTVVDSGILVSETQTAELANPAGHDG